VFFFLVGGGEGEERKGMLVFGSFLTTKGEEEDKGGPTRREMVMTSVPNLDSNMICSGVMCSFRQVVLLRVGEGKRGGRCQDMVEEERRDRRSGEGGEEGVEVLLLVPVLVLVLVLFCGFFMRMRESGRGVGPLSGAAAWTKGERWRRRRRRREGGRRRRE
jgi:hypothetical protein